MSDDAELEVGRVEGGAGSGALPREVFLALAAVGWADGNLDADEADAIVAAALDAGYTLEEVADIEAATKAPTTVAKLSFDALTAAERAFVFSVGVWVSALDGERSFAELRVLGELGDALGLDGAAQAAADERVLEVARRSEDHRPGRFDLGTLREIVDADDWLAAIGGVADDA